MKSGGIVTVAAAIAALAVPAAAGRPPATERSEAPAQLAADQVLPICDRALVAAMGGGDAALVLEIAVRDRPAAEAATIRNICFVYLLGAVAFMKHAQEQSDRPSTAEPAAPALSI